MDRKKIAAGLLVLSMIYGGVLAVLGLLESGAVSVVALVGAVVLGIGWVLLGVLSRDAA